MYNKQRTHNDGIDNELQLTWLFIIDAMLLKSFGKNSEGEHPPAVKVLSGCQEAVKKLSRAVHKKT